MRKEAAVFGATVTTILTVYLAAAAAIMLRSSAPALDHAVGKLVGVLAGGAAIAAFAFLYEALSERLEGDRQSRAGRLTPPR